MFNFVLKFTLKFQSKYLIYISWALAAEMQKALPTLLGV